MINYEYVPHNGVHTSIKAALNIVPKVGSIGAKVMDFMRQRDDYGATLEEVETGTRISGNTVRPRMKTLRQRGQVVDSGTTRKTLAGNDAIVWVITEAWKIAAAPSKQPQGHA